MGQTSTDSSAILVIDDDNLLRGMMGEFLTEVGYKVYSAGSGEEALLLFTRYPKEIVLVITDMGLPGISGAELLEKIRQINPLIKTIAMSGFGGEEMLHQIRASEAGMFLPKPFSRDDLLKIVESYMGSRS